MKGDVDGVRCRTVQILPEMTGQDCMHEAYLRHYRVMGSCTRVLLLWLLHSDSYRTLYISLQGVCVDADYMIMTCLDTL